MTIKDEIKSSLGDKQEILELRYSSSKIIFIFMTLIFFLVFYFLGGGIGKEKLEKILSPIYILFIFSLNLYIFFLGKKIFPEKKVFSYILSGIFFILSIVFILAVIL